MPVNDPRPITRYPGEWCNRCNRAVVCGFNVPNEIWESIVKGRWKIVCILCFDELSEDTGIHWDDDVELFPVSRATWKSPQMVLSEPLDKIKNR